MWVRFFLILFSVTAVADVNTAKMPTGPGNTGNAETYPNRNTNRDGTGHIIRDPDPQIPTTSAYETTKDPHSQTKTSEMKDYRLTPDVHAE